MSVKEIGEAFVTATDTWRGCDWTAYCGASGLDLCGRTGNEAAFWTEVTGSGQSQDWQLAAEWLGQVELKAEAARQEGEAAVRAAGRGDLQESLRHAQHACWLEQEAGRVACRPAAWAPLCHAIARTMAEERTTSTGPDPGRCDAKQTDTLLACIRLFRAELGRQQEFLTALQGELEQLANQQEELGASPGHGCQRATATSTEQESLP
jgi:hypothetical protein